MSSKSRQALAAVKTYEMVTKYPEDLVTVLDPRHWLHGKVPLARYEQDGKEMQALRRSIASIGKQEPAICRVVERDGETQLHVIGGNRGTICSMIVNAERGLDGNPPITIKVDPRYGLSDEQATELYRTLNQEREPNDAMTRIAGAKTQLDLGVSEADVCERWGFPSLPALRAGLNVLGAAPEVKTALSLGALSLAAATRIAKLPLDSQVAAMNQAAPVTKRKYLSPESRQELRALIRAHITDSIPEHAQIRRLAEAL